MKNPIKAPLILIIIILNFLFYSCIEDVPESPAGVSNKFIFTDITIDSIYDSSVSIICGMENFKGIAIKQIGFCYSQLNNPDTSDLYTILDPVYNSLEIKDSLTNLQPGTIYFARAYIAYYGTIIYSNEISFFTYYGTISDYDGNNYYTTQIGNQIWMAENLKTSHYADGTAIPMIENNSIWASLNYDDKAYCYYGNSPSNGVTYGVLYTWAAAMNGKNSSSLNPSDIQGVCPNGWHLPSNAEWTVLINFLGGPSDAGRKMQEAGIDYWGSANIHATNASGFTALPGGCRYYYGEFYYIGSNAFFSSTTEYESTNIWVCRLGLYGSSVQQNSHPKKGGFSVRCLTDN
ncbi:FISUMP domain-containing protein [Bacteroidota bacterium]